MTKVVKHNFKHESFKTSLLDKICKYLKSLVEDESISGFEILPGVIIKDGIRIRIYKHKFGKTAWFEYIIDISELGEFTVCDIFEDIYKFEIDHRVFDMWEFIRESKNNLVQFCR